MSLEAYPIGDYINNHTYRLEGKTYHIKDKIKAVGGKWAGSFWTVTEEAADKLNAIKYKRVKHKAHCHEPEGECWANNKDIERGYVILGCSLCDTPQSCGDKVAIVQ